MGSFLRVSGSTLWAPGTSPLDPTEATPTVEHINHMDYCNVNDAVYGSGSGGGDITSTNLYTSSVEMVTSPETYPIWKTRKPVILIWNRRGNNNSAAAVLHHCYRYLVVAPGTVRNPSSILLPTTDGSGEAGHMGPTTTIQASTSNETTNTGSTIVLEWEDPFNTMYQGNPTSSLLFGSANSSTTSFNPTGSVSKSRNVSAVSLNSSVHLASMTHSGAQFRNLPYRTIDVNATNGNHLDHLTTVHQQSSDVVINILDHWNHADDPTFQPYRIRDAVRTLPVFC
jgi:hypothetical protein